MQIIKLINPKTQAGNRPTQPTNWTKENTLTEHKWGKTNMVQVELICNHKGWEEKMAGSNTKHDAWRETLST